MISLLRCSKKIEILGQLKTRSFQYRFYAKFAPDHQSEDWNEQKSERLKSRLGRLVTTNEMELSSRHQRAAEEAKLRKMKAETGQQKQDMQYLLTPYLEEYFSSLSNVLEGKMPKLLKERMVVVSFLGLKRLSQLENSFTVDQQVEKLLKQGKLPHAIHLCKMAKETGSVGMNQILKYLVQKGQKDTATKVLNVLKKSGCLPTDRTPVILVKNISTSGKKLSPTDVQKLLKNYEFSLAKTKSTQAKTIISNALLDNLVKNSSTKYAIAMYSDIPDRGRFSRDCQTYTTMLNMISHQPMPLEKEIIDLRKEIWFEVERRQEDGALSIDSKLVDAYCNSLSLQTDPRYFKMISEVNDKYYSLDMSQEPEGSRKFPFTERQFDILIKSTVNTESFSQASKLFDRIQEFKHVVLDLQIYHNLLRSAYLWKNSHIATVKILNQMIIDMKNGKEKSILNSLTIHLAFRNFLKYRGQEIDLDFIEKLIHEILPEFNIKIDEMIMRSYIALYCKVFRDSHGHKPRPNIGNHIVSFIRDNINALSQVSHRQPHPEKLRKALLNGSNICSYVIKHPNNNELSEEAITGIKEVKDKLDSLAKELNKNFEKTKEESAKPKVSKKKDQKKEDNEDEEDEVFTLV